MDRDAASRRPQMIGYRGNEAGQKRPPSPQAIQQKNRQHQASDPPCYNQFPVTHLRTLLVLIVELKQGGDRSGAFKTTSSFDLNFTTSPESEIMERFYIETGGPPGNSDTSDPDRQLEEDSEGEDHNRDDEKKH